MHELSIATSILDTVITEVKKQNLSKVTLIALRIGALTDIVPEALEFGFDAIKVDTILADAVLKIEHIPVRGHCRGCSVGFEVKEFSFICPNCGSYDIKTEQGSELDIAYLEVDD